MLSPFPLFINNCSLFVSASCQYSKKSLCDISFLSDLLCFYINNDMVFNKRPLDTANSLHQDDKNSNAITLGLF